MGRRPCCAKVGVSRGAWSALEDQILRNYIKIHGDGNWRNLPQRAGLNRCGKSCRLRWLNYLRPDIKRGDISMEEEDLIIRLHNLLGNRWALIAGRLPGRTDNEIKNYWNTTLVKKLNGQKSRPSIIRFKSEEEKPVENCSPDIPQVIRPKATRCSKVVISPEDVLINRNVGYMTTSSFSVDDDSLNFLMDFNVDEVLIPDVLNSNFSPIHIHDMHENGSNMVDGDNICPFFSGCPLSEDEVSFEKEMKCDPIQPTLELELKKVVSFLDLEDEWKDL